MERASKSLGNDSNVWNCYALFLMNSQKAVEQVQKYLDCRKKEYRCLMATCRIDVLEEDFERVATCVLQMYHHLSELENEQDERRQLKMLLRNLIKKTQVKLVIHIHSLFIDYSFILGLFR